MKRCLSQLVFALLIINALAIVGFNVKPLKEWTGGTIYIRADGSVDPPGAPIQTSDFVIYVLTDNIESSGDGIVIERSDIIIDGAGYTLQGAGIGKGIDMTGRSNITIKNIVIKNFDYGIRLEGSSNNIISGNNITTNNWYGVVLSYSSNNTISGNNIANNEAGVDLDHSSNNIVSGNIFVGDGLLVYDSFDNVVVNNLVNGKPLVYLENVSGAEVNDAGQVILVNCQSITVKNLNLSNTAAGIQLLRTTNTTIYENNITNNSDGICLRYSSNNIINGNNITNSCWEGIWLYHSLNIIMSGNNMAYNWQGIVLDNSSSNKVFGNEIRASYSYAVKLVRSSNNGIFGNNITKNDYGIFLDDLSNTNNITENNILGNKYEGIFIRDSSYNNVFENNITANSAGIIIGGPNNNVFRNYVTNSDTGVGLASSFNNIVYENYITNCGYAVTLRYDSNETISKNYLINNSYGIALSGSSTIYVIKNNITKNNLGGIHIEWSSQINIYRNYITKNGWLGGIYLKYSSNINIRENNMIGNWMDAIRAEYPLTSSIICRNNITENSGGIYLSDSSANTISGNNITNNLQGIYLWFCSDNRIYENNIEANKYTGIRFYKSSYNTIKSNNILNNDYGVDIVGSSNNIIWDNMIMANNYGIRLCRSPPNGISRESSYNNIIRNNITCNLYGLWLEDSSNNTVYHNNFINNIRQADIYSAGYANIWDNGYPSGGNYWSDYTGVDYYSGSNQDQPGSDGIGDTPHIIDENNVDYYPLMGSFNSLRVLAEHIIDIVSNSTMEAFQYDEQSKTLILRVSNKTSEQTHGFCRITIPHTLIPSPYNVTVNNVPIQYSTIFENETISIIYFTYKHSTIEIKITQQPPPPPTYTLTISTSTGGSTDPPPATYTYPEGTEVSVTAIPSIGFSFSHWLLNGSFRANNPITIVMDADYTLVAYFIDDIPPQINQPIQQPPPDEVQPGQEVHVWVNVTDLGTGIKNVTLWYSIDNGTTWTLVNMTAYREIYEALWGATIPAYGNCTWVTYKILAYDNAENMAVQDNKGYNYQYHVIPEYPSTVQILVILMLTALIAIIWKTKRKHQFTNFLYKLQQFH